MFGSIFLLSQFLQSVGGYSPTEAGLRMLPWTGMPMIVAPIAGVLSDRIGGRPVVAAGLALQAIGLGLLALIVEPDVSYAAPAARADHLRHRHGAVLRPRRQPGHVQRPPRGAGHRLRRQQRAPRGRRRPRRRGPGRDLLRPGRLRIRHQFVDGLIPALWVGAGAVALAAAVALLMPRRRKADGPAAGLSTAAPAAI